MTTSLFIGVNAPSNLIEEINSKSVNSAQISISAIRYSKLISEGIESCTSDHKSLFLAPIGMFPFSKIIFFYKKNDFGKRYYIPFVNIIFLKQICISFYTLFFILKWVLETKSRKKYLFFGFLYLPFLISIIPFKILKKVSVISFVPDMPIYMYSYTKNTSLFKKILKKPYILLTNILTNNIDFFVFITKYMSSHFPTKPFFIIEGFTDSKLLKSELNYLNKINNKKAIMYAGALFEKFGIGTLIDAFMEIPGDYELWLFGYGDLVDYINTKSKIDNRIIFYGNVSNEIVFEFEKKAKLLVNPRPLDHEFTKFSFPSKILEYMSSGTPVITTNLKGIPNEYNDKLFYFVDDSFLEIKNGLIKYLNISDQDLYNFGIIAMNFSIKEKNNIKQMNKLIKNLESI